MIWLDDFNPDNEPFNSTRYIRNLMGRRFFDFLKKTFNSTRYIRNSPIGL